MKEVLKPFDLTNCPISRLSEGMQSFMKAIVSVYPYYLGKEKMPPHCWSVRHKGNLKTMEINPTSIHSLEFFYCPFFTLLRSNMLVISVYSFLCSSLFLHWFFALIFIFWNMKVLFRIACRILLSDKLQSAEVSYEQRTLNNWSRVHAVWSTLKRDHWKGSRCTQGNQVSFNWMTSSAI